MKLKFIFVGKTKPSWLQQGEAEYLKRLCQFAKTEVVIVPENTKGEPEKIKKLEGRSILHKIKSTDWVCLLEVDGKALTSTKLAKQMQNWEVNNGGHLTFIVGGSLGVSQEVFDRANFHLSLSKMTFPHEMIRAFLFEQVYRALTIIHRKTYHK